jgi:hypothetical protein
MEKPSTTRPSFLFGIGIAALLILKFIITTFVVREQISGLFAVDFVIFFIMIYFFNKHLMAIDVYQPKPVSKDRELSIGNMFAYGFKLTAMANILYLALLLLLIFTVPACKENYLEMVRTGIENFAQKEGSEINMQEQMAFYQENFVPIVISSTIYLSLLSGALGSILVAIYLKKKYHK